MANLKALNADGIPIYIAATGSGDDTDPLIMLRQEILPVDAATLSAQQAAQTSLNSITTSTANISHCDTTNVTVVSSALPAGAATVAAQTTAQASLTSIDNKLTDLNTYNVVTASFTRPADTANYATGDLIANSITAGSVVVPSAALARANDIPFIIQRLRLHKSTNTTNNAKFRVHFYRAIPAVTNGDNGALSTTQTLHKIGFVDIDMTADTTGNDGAYGIGAFTQGTGALCLPSTGTQNIFWLIEARAGYSPGNAEVFTAQFEVFQD